MSFPWTRPNEVLLQSELPGHVYYGEYGIKRSTPVIPYFHDRIRVRGGPIDFNTFVYHTNGK